MRRATFAFIILCAATDVLGSSLSVRMKETTVVDGAMPQLHAVITNVSTAPVVVRTAPPPLVTIRPVEVSPNRCTLRRLHGPVPSATAKSTTSLKPGESVEVALDVASTYPLGLRPGNYKVGVAYMHGSERAGVEVSLTVVAPSGAKAAAYRDFIAVCGPALGLGTTVSKNALEFVKNNRNFGLSYPLLEIIARGGPHELMAAANAELLNAPGYERVARENLARVEQERAARERRAIFEREHNRHILANGADATAFRDLGTIESPANFRPYELFLKNHPRSFFASAVLHRMIVAVERGIVPFGRTAESERELLYRRLLREYPNSYHAAEVARSAYGQRIAKSVQ